MKILVLSLLRLGDIIQQEPLLQALHVQYPQAQIHLAINSQFRSIAGVLKAPIEKYHLFDRDLLQRSIGEAQYNLFSSFDLLESFISEINSEQYDMIFNWTHNRLSAFLMGTFHANQKMGLHMDHGQMRGLENRWLKYFNDHFSGNSKSFFHYTEILGEAFRLPTVRTRALVSTEKKQILLQCLTSDEKKNWPLGSYLKLKNQLEATGNYVVKVLAAPSEVLALTKYFTANCLVVASLEQLEAVFAESCLLISGDTSIKHLAAREGLPTLEISLGGATPVKTAAFSEISQNIVASSSCYPCVHSEKCSQPKFICHETVSVNAVAEKALNILKGEGPGKGLDIFQFEKIVWQNYLDENLKAETLVFSSLSQEKISGLAKGTDLLMAKQLKFESCEDFSFIFSSLQKLWVDGSDPGAYFQKLAHVFKDRYANAESAVSALKKALAESRELIQIRRKMIENFLSPEEKNAN